MGWVRGSGLADIFRTTTLGLENTQMSGFDYLSLEERFAVTHFVMGLAQDRPATTTAELDSLDRQFSLSQGAREPNTIPLRLAVEKLAAEGEAAHSASEEEIEALAVTEPRGAGLFEQIVHSQNVDRVGALLRADPSWQDDPLRLKALATSGAPANGFAVSAERLTLQEWGHLGRYLAGRFGPRQDR